MGESTCLVNSLSLASSMPHEPNNHGNHGNALGDSVSFGRFTSESLAWEKWSSFPHKRYVEEAKSYAQPGSVAEKKAFFEAHYKKVAAQKAAAAAAALLEQEKAKSEAEGRICDTSYGARDSKATILLKSHYLPTRTSNLRALQTTLHANKPQPVASNLIMTVNEEQQIKTRDASNAIDATCHMPTVKPVVPRTEKTLVVAEDQVSVSEDSGTSHMERPLLKSKLNTDQEVLQPKNRRKPAMPSFRSPSIGKKQSRMPASPGKYLASMHPQKENMVTPISKNSTAMLSTDKKRSAPRSLYTLMNSGSVKESCKVNSPALREIGSTKPAPSAHSTPKRYATPTMTPFKVKNGENKQPVATPLVKRRTETPVHPSAVGSKTPVHPSAVGSKTPGQKWQIFSSVTKSLGAYKNKLQSPTISSPFTLRTEERAARRKQKLEEKFNEKAAQKAQQQTTLKEKAETEFRRFRQSFCFKARPLPSFYNARETPESPIMKTPQANLKCLTPERKPQSTVSQPSLTKKSSRRLWKTNDQNIANHPLCSLARRINHENTCPNIQH